MTAQHAPDTPPLWRRGFSLPQTHLGWWAVGLAGPSWVLTVYSLVNQLVGGSDCLRWLAELLR